MRQAIVTGAAGGIGRAIAERLAAAGYRVGILDLESAHPETVAHAIDGAVALVADVTEPTSIEGALDRLGAAPDLLVNNAGIVTFGPLLEQPPEDFRRTVEVNLLGCYHMSRACARRMTSGGHIVSITSINGLTPSPGTGAYPATKAAIAQLTRQLALECADRGIRANAIAPGFIDAGISAPIYADPKIRKLRSDGVPLGRLGTAEDIANAVLFLDSDAGAYVNGHELVVDGGVVHSLLTQLPRE
jgi:NAD(P)-dependent dehydrogenase (short-subunit alcohol dehydrogenase family)